MPSLLSLIQQVRLSPQLFDGPPLVIWTEPGEDPALIRVAHGHKDGARSGAPYGVLGRHWHGASEGGTVYRRKPCADYEQGGPDPGISRLRPTLQKSAILLEHHGFWTRRAACLWVNGNLNDILANKRPLDRQAALSPRRRADFDPSGIAFPLMPAPRRCLGGSLSKPSTRGRARDARRLGFAALASSR
jgi:hypothetical protein